MMHPHQPEQAMPLDYDSRPPPRRRLVMWLVVLGLAAGLICLAVYFLWLQATPPWTPSGQVVVVQPLPTPSQGQMTAAPLPPEGVELTIKQRQSRWLPGGRLKLSIDDITGGQVLISISDADGTVLLGPKSVKRGDTLAFSDGQSPLRLEVLRLRNHLTGDDFGEFRLTSPTGQQPLSEADKVEHLLERIAALEGAVFIRNGSEHSAAEAVEHLRSKWQRAGGAEDPSATAGQFIESIATRSSLSGRPYLIRLPDGREVESGRWLREQLAELESP